MAAHATDCRSEDQVLMADAVSGRNQFGRGSTIDKRLTLPRFQRRTQFSLARDAAL